MPAHALIYPMFAMVLLSFIVVLTLFRVRSKSVQDGKVKASHFQTYTGPPEPDKSIQISRHFSNLFEAPVLFYAVCITGIVLGMTDLAFHILAWVYVGLRICHTLIHTGPNVLIWRIGAYFTSWFVLVGLWTYLVVHVS